MSQYFDLFQLPEGFALDEAELEPATAHSPPVSIPTAAPPRPHSSRNRP